MMSVSLRISCLQVIFACRKILRLGAGGFTSPKEGVVRTFIAFKNPSPRLGLNPRTLIQWQARYYTAEATFESAYSSFYSGI
jgi:hypothetical protein